MMIFLYTYLHRLWNPAIVNIRELEIGKEGGKERKGRLKEENKEIQAWFMNFMMGSVCIQYDDNILREFRSSEIHIIISYRIIGK